MQTMVQVYAAKTEERANKLNYDICEAFAGSGHFKDNHLVVSQVSPIHDQETDEVKAYGFWVYFDTVEMDDDIRVDILVDRTGVVHSEVNKED